MQRSILLLSSSNLSFLTLNRIQKKFMKTFFEIKDNILDKRLTQYVKSMEFVENRQTVSLKVNELVDLFAEHFTRNHDREMALRELESKAENLEMRRKDAVLISYFCGAVTIILLLLITLLSISDDTLQKQYGDTEMELLSSLHTFRFLFMLVFLLAASACVLKFLRKYHINYLYIFDFDAQYKVSHSQLFKVSNSSILKIE